MFKSFSLLPFKNRRYGSSIPIVPLLVLALTGAGSEAWADNSLQLGTLSELNQCLPSLPLASGGSNLVPCALRFNALGEINFSFKNRGAVPINMVAPGAPRPKNAEPAGPPIRIDVYMQNTRIESVYHPALAAGQVKEINVKIPSNYTKPKCAEVRALRIVLDPQNQIPEVDDSDNLVDRPSADRPCPDMTIESIKKNANSAHTEFVAEVKLVNNGNAPARFRYLAMTSSNAAFSPLPDLDYDILMELEPGQSKKFTVGNAWGMSSMWVRVMLDRMNEVAELDEGNNIKEKTLD
jgi:hypothetical protein